jgi:GNAT superfamily N-acetyltransferase
MSVRMAVHEDKESVMKLVYHLGYQIEDKKAFDSVWRITTTSPHQGILVHEMNETITAYLAFSIKPQLRLSGMSMEIDELIVDPAFTGKGIGGELISYLKVFARNEGVKRIVISTNKDRESFERQFYLKQGFELKNSALFKMDL